MKRLVTGTALALAVAVAPGVLALDKAAAVGASGTAAKADTNASAHTDAESALRGIQGLRESMDAATQRGDLPEFRRLHQDIAERLRNVRSAMERAVFLGAWRDREAKEAAFDLTWRIDAIQSLNFIVLAFTSDFYPNAVGKPTPSVKDATGKLFTQVDHLVDAVAELNRRASTNARAAR